MRDSLGGSFLRACIRSALGRDSYLVPTLNRIPILRSMVTKRSTGRDSRKGGCEKGFSHQRPDASAMREVPLLDTLYYSDTEYLYRSEYCHSAA